jgi:HD superfamily phosphohydrolase
LHCGVSYGRYDWQRLVQTVAAMRAEEGPRIGVAEGGWHAAEGLIVARYFMFTQVYFHKTRVIYDHHLHRALAAMLPGRLFPGPKALERYLKWDDWRVLGLLADGKGGDDGSRLANRLHFREIIHTPETPAPNDLAHLAEWRVALGPLLAAEMSAEKSWYKAGPSDVQVLADTPKPEVKPLSTYSSIVRNIEPIRQVRLYARPEKRADAIACIAGI